MYPAHFISTEDVAGGQSCFYSHALGDHTGTRDRNHSRDRRKWNLQRGRRHSERKGERLGEQYKRGNSRDSMRVPVRITNIRRVKNRANLPAILAQKEMKGATPSGKGTKNNRE